MDKRGQGAQFSWVFAVFAGMIIFMFFMGFGVKYMDLQETKESAAIARNFNNLVTSAKSSEQYLSYSPNIPPFKLFFDLDDCSTFWINDDVSLRVFGIVFGSNALSSDYVIWSKSWYAPFRVDNFVYVSDVSRKYYFDPSFASLSSLMEEKFLIVSNPSDADVVVLPIDVGNIYPGSEIVVSSSSVKFVEEGSEFSHHSDEFIYAAIFSNDAFQYKCNYDKLIERFEFMKSSYLYKAQNLGGCNYSPIISALGSLSVDDSSALESENLALSNFECEVVF
ncbi:hypothetical protein HOA59_02055 [archaeon]|nr:hypothetical protein [archaeon]MBT6824199.1 hypothetical protein [archaeon]MBT7106737.1 hypothetical protein [archaeon]MBT7297569.1 hypothetical protein [archaeon]